MVGEGMLLLLVGGEARHRLGQLDALEGHLARGRVWLGVGLGLGLGLGLGFDALERHRLRRALELVAMARVHQLERLHLLGADLLLAQPQLIVRRRAPRGRAPSRLNGGGAHVGCPVVGGPPVLAGDERRDGEDGRALGRLRHLVQG